MNPEPGRPVLIAGPTASGKSALAMALAEHGGGVVINADSMQVYRDLQVLTARPSPADEAAVPHRLYGHVPAQQAYSVARWLDDVSAVIAEVEAAGKTAIITGGTGLYFKALLEGLSPVPQIPPEVRARWRQFAHEHSMAGTPEALFQELQRRDPVMAARLAPTDRQRLTRALEVIDGTGRSLADWQTVPGRPRLRKADCRCLVVLPPRDVLRARCDERFDRMIAQGALAEVRDLLALGLPDNTPVMRALGVGPLAAHLKGVNTLEEAVACAKADTRQYVKRQETWIRRNMISWRRIDFSNLEKNIASILPMFD